VLTNLRRVWYLIGRGQPVRWVVLVLLALLMSLFEMIGALLVFMLLGLVADPSSAIVLPLVGDVRAMAGGMDDRDLLLRLVAVIAVFFVVRGVVQVVVVYVQSRVINNAGARLSNKLVEGYLRWPYEVHLRRSSAELIRNGHQAVLALENQVFGPLVRVAAEVFVMIGVLAVLISIAPAATGLAVVLIGGTATSVLLIIQPRLKRLGQSAHAAQRDTLASLQQSLHGIRDIKILAREQFFARRYGRSRLHLARMKYLRDTVTKLPATILEVALMGFILLFFGLTVASGESAQSTLPVLGLFAYAGLRLQPSVQKVVAGINNVRYADAPIQDLYADLRAVDLDRSTPQDVDPLHLTTAINLEKVSLRYQGVDRDALSKIDLTIRAGEQIGICGPTGGGKTTLADVIAGLLEPTAGRVTVDGHDIVGRIRAWQRNLGVVPQMVFLLDDTLRRNIALGVGNSDIDEGALHEAIELAQLSEFVAELPDGLDTTVGERGVRISGGQRQRIAIARALYRSPEVLIFDEGTSALDNVTESKLMDSIERLRGRHTIILVAHRLSTVRTSDRVVFIENGSITGVGSYESLYAENDAFRTMAGSS